jgi:transglutaminase-like putative cysteine protease
MRFASAHKLVSYLLVLVALVALASTRALELLAGLSFVALAGASYVADPGTRLAALLDRRTTAVRIALALVLAASVWHVMRQLPEPGPAFEPLLALLAYKLFYRRTHRDYMHVYALAFLVVLLASTFAASVMFLVAFAGYVILATWALILFHLRREMEENYLVKHSAEAPSQKVGVARILGSRRVVGGAFFGATGGVAVAVFLGAVAVFIALPRLGAGLVLGPTVTSPTVAGFGDEVALGRYGTATGRGHDVLLRASVPALSALADDQARREAAEHLYFRGAVFDRYDNGRWTHARLPELRTAIDSDGNRHWVGEAGVSSSVTPADGEADRIEQNKQDIELSGLPATVLFALDRPLGFELPAARLGARSTLRVVPRWSGETALRVGGSDEGDSFITLAHAHYTAYSSDPLLLDLPSTRLPPEVRSAYLVIPPELTARVGTLADRIAAGAGSTSDAAKAGAVIDWLQAHHGYTADPPAHAGADPVEDFIFGRGPGHCELFASAAVLLLRGSGIPARYVTGFRGGDWNAVGGYLSVRDDRAHAWAEAFVSSRGYGRWMRVDATPPGAAPPAPARMADLADAVEHLWTRWVVGFDLGRQQDLVHRVGRGFARIVSGETRARTAQRRWPMVDLVPALAVLALGIALIVVARRMPRRRTLLPWPASVGKRGMRTPAERRNAIAVERLYRRTVTRLTRAGWPRRPSETPREYAVRLRSCDAVANDAFDRLTDRYAAARFGGHPVDDEMILTLGRELASGGVPAKMATLN